MIANRNQALSQPAKPSPSRRPEKTPRLPQPRLDPKAEMRLFLADMTQLIDSFPAPRYHEPEAQERREN
jgi:hypothetical protein